MNKSEMIPLIVGAMILVPLGGILLATVDGDIMRRAIAAVVIAAALLMLTGRSYNGPRTFPTSLGVGAVSGLLTGSTGMGGPPVLFYTLTGEGAARRARGGMQVMSVFIEGLTVGGFLIAGILTPAYLTLTAALLPIMLAGTWIGARLFGRTSDQHFRIGALWFMVAVGTVVLVS
jgi:uncharacterized membrane protein YfcA